MGFGPFYCIETLQESVYHFPMSHNTKKVVVAVSGGFDPLHIGHVRMMEEAKALGTYLVVILNNDNWLRAKKGKPFMQEQERKEIIEALRCVDEVVLTKHPENPTDMSVADALAEIKPDIFANGGDRKLGTHAPKESIVCAEIGCKEVFGIGHGGKVQSSSWLIDEAIKAKQG